MLDISGTCDNINTLKIEIFLNKLNYLCTKFFADKIIISLSTHFSNCESIKEMLNLFNSCLDDNTIIGTSFYLGGTYDYYSNTDTYIGFGFNSDKVSTFDRYFINNLEYDNVWFGLFDDSLDDYVFENYKDNKVMLACRPSQVSLGLINDNFMVRSTSTYGFDGVLEVLDSYNKDIVNLNYDEILNEQKNMVCHMSTLQFALKIRDKNFDFLKKYFLFDFASYTDYLNFVKWTPILINKYNLNNEEVLAVIEILCYINNYFGDKSEYDTADKVLYLKNKCRELITN
jgi:hypothetical protein